MKYFMSDFMVFSMTVHKYICKSQKLVIQVSLNLIKGITVFWISQTEPMPFWFPNKIHQMQ